MESYNMYIHHKEDMSVIKHMNYELVQSISSYQRENKFYHLTFLLSFSRV